MLQRTHVEVQKNRRFFGGGYKKKTPISAKRKKIFTHKNPQILKTNNPPPIKEKFSFSWRGFLFSDAVYWKIEEHNQNRP